MLFNPPQLLAAIVGADPVDDLRRRQRAVRLDDRSLAVDPLRLDPVQPGRLHRQRARHDPDPALGLGPAVLPLDPGPYSLADVPTGVVPDQQQRPLAPLRQSLADPTQIVFGDLAHRAAVNESDHHAAAVGPQQPVAGQRLRAGAGGLGPGLVHPLRLVTGPGVQLGPRQPTPPDLVLEPEDPVGVPLGQADQPVARPFFRRYAGSGLVIHRLARFQPIPIRTSAWRTDSPLIGREVSP